MEKALKDIRIWFRSDSTSRALCLTVPKNKDLDQAEQVASRSRSDFTLWTICLTLLKYKLQDQVLLHPLDLWF